MVHRDLKPENVLVSNSHYASDPTKIESFWEDKPVIAKLTDFGESRSEIIQTCSLAHTRTHNVKRGSPIYMAPELHLGDADSLTIEELKAVDVWGLGMIFFIMVNPNLSYPYQAEMEDLKAKGIKSSLVWHIMRKGDLPNHDEKYVNDHKSSWAGVVEAFNAAARFKSSERASVTKILQLFKKPLGGLM